MTSSRVTGSVVSSPWTTMPSVSPTRTTSIPASSTIFANGKSYAVSAVIFVPASFIFWRSGTVTFRSMKKASRTDPEGFPLRGRSASPPVHDDRGRPSISCGTANPLCLSAYRAPSRSSRRVRSTLARLFGSKRYVVLHALLHAPNLVDQVREIAALLDEVDRRAVDHEKRRFRILMEELPVRLDQRLEVAWRDAPFEL